MLSKESPWRRLRFGRDNSDWQAQIYPDTSFKGCRICVQQPDAKLQSSGSPRNNLEEDQQISSSYSRYFPNETLFFKNVTTSDAGFYTYVAKNYQRTIMASSTVEVRWRSCSSIKSGRSGSSSGNYIIDPDGKGGVAPFSVYCDMSDKGGVGVTVISHDSESRTYLNNIPGCNLNPGCYSKNVTYIGVNTAQLAALTRVSQNCEQSRRSLLGGYHVTGRGWTIGEELLVL